MGGGGVPLQWPFLEGLRAQMSSPVPTALLFAIERVWRRFIAYLVLDYNKHNRCEKTKLDLSLHYCSLCWCVPMKCTACFQEMNEIILARNRVCNVESVPGFMILCWTFIRVQSEAGSSQVSPQLRGPSKPDLQGDHFFFHISPYIQQEQTKENDVPKPQKT